MQLCICSLCIHVCPCMCIFKCSTLYILICMLCVLDLAWSWLYLSLTDCVCGCVCACASAFALYNAIKPLFYVCVWLMCALANSIRPHCGALSHFKCPVLPMWNCRKRLSTCRVCPLLCHLDLNACSSLNEEQQQEGRLSTLEGRTLISLMLKTACELFYWRNFR